MGGRNIGASKRISKSGTPTWSLSSLQFSTDRGYKLGRSGSHGWERGTDIIRSLI